MTHLPKTIPAIFYVCRYSGSGLFLSAEHLAANFILYSDTWEWRNHLGEGGSGQRMIVWAEAWEESVKAGYPCRGLSVTFERSLNIWVERIPAP